MIRSLKGKIAESIAERARVKGFPPELITAAENKLTMIEAATVLEDLKSPPGNKLHALKDDRKGQHAIRINDQWRVCFTWKDGGAEDLEITDYHG